MRVRTASGRLLRLGSSCWRPTTTLLMRSRKRWVTLASTLVSVRRASLFLARDISVI